MSVDEEAALLHSQYGDYFNRSARPPQMEFPGMTDAERVEALMARAETAGPELRDMMDATRFRTQAGEVNLAEPKTLERMYDKQSIEFVDVEQTLDAARGRISYNRLQQAYEGLADLSTNYDVVRVKDRFFLPQESGYRDILVNVRHPDGFVSEIQLQVRPWGEAKPFDGYDQYRITHDKSILEQSQALYEGVEAKYKGGSK
jgi:hypothetical protein